MSSVYNQHKHRKLTGLVAAERASKCFQCESIAPRAELFHGWCQRCMARWTATADPVMLVQARLGYSPAICVPAPSARQVDQIIETIVCPKHDQDYLPLLHFMGNPTVGRMQALWNFIKTMETLELKTTGEVFRLTRSSHDTTHRCGLHAPVQISTLNSLFSRIAYADGFSLLNRDRHLLEYLEYFIAQNRLFIYQLRRVDPDRIASRLFQQKYGPNDKRPLVTSWPFLHEERAHDHADILAVDAVVPQGIPEQWRQDMCQDLMVAVLSGEVTVGNLQDAVGEHIKRVFKMHPTKYGPLSLDAPAPWDTGDNPRTLGQMLSTVDYAGRADCGEHRYDQAARGTYHEGFQRPVGLSMIGELLRDKHDGVAIEALSLPDERDEYDDDVADVYLADLHPRGYRGSSYAPTARPQRR